MSTQLPEGFTLDRAPPPLPDGFQLDAPSSSVGDKINTGVQWLGTQFTKGLTGAAGLPADLQALGQKGADYALSKITGRDFNTPAPTMPGSADLNKVAFKDIGLPEVNAADNPNLGKLGKFIDLIPQAAVGAKAFGQAFLPTATSSVASEAAGQATEGTPYEMPARLAAALAGQKAGQRINTPLPADLTPEQARLVQLAKADPNIKDTLTVGQETGRLRGVESALARFPTSAGQFANAGEKQAVGINKAALATMDAPADLERVDPTSMTRAFAAKNAEFNAAKNAMGPVELTPDFHNKIADINATYRVNNAPSSLVPSVERKMADFETEFLGKKVPLAGDLSGEQYQQFRKGLNDAAQATTDTSARKALQGIRTALDDAAEASSAAEATAAFKVARKNWGNLKTISKAAAGGSMDTRAAGDLSANALTGALKQFQGADKFATTEGGLNDIARLSGYLKDTRPNSGTPQTLMMQNLLSGGALLGGGGAGFLAGGPAGAAAAAGGLAAPNLLARALTGSTGAGFVKKYLTNQSLAKQSMSERLAQALIGARVGAH